MISMHVYHCLFDIIMHTGTSKYLSAKVPDGTSNLENTVEYCIKGMYDNETIIPNAGFHTGVVIGGGEDKR